MQSKILFHIFFIYCFIYTEHQVCNVFDVSTRVISLLLERIIIWKIETTVGGSFYYKPFNFIDIQHRLLIRIKGTLYAR